MQAKCKEDKEVKKKQPSHGDVIYEKANLFNADHSYARRNFLHQKRREVQERA
jgi:hypothetical protein